MSAPVSSRPSAWRVVVTFGVVSLFADMVYEGGRSLYGPALLALGASGAVVGLVTGAGEAMALLLRLAAGPTADRRGAHWSFTIAGYGLTAVCVPLLALAPRLGAAGLAFGAAMILLERSGKAVRSPSKSALLATAARSLGRGRGFGVHKALDQVGAFAGPLLVAAVVAASASPWPGFACLAVPGALAMLVLLRLRHTLHGEVPGGPATPDGAPTPATSSPTTDATTPPTSPLTTPVTTTDDTAPHTGGPDVDEEATSPTGATGHATDTRGATGTDVVNGRRAWWRTALGADLPAAFLRYALAAGVTTAGLVTFAVISVHLTRDLGMSAASIPLVYAGAMAAEAVAALVTGRVFDRHGPATLLVVPVVVALVPPLAFGASPTLALAGVVLWGCATGIQDSTIKALVADLVPAASLATAYGVFAAVQGVFALVGGATAGFLLDRSVPTLVVLVAASQIVAAVLLVRTMSARAHR